MNIKSNKSKMSTSNKVLIVSVIAVVLFTIVSFILQFVTGTEVSSTLTDHWFTFWTAEILVLSGIKITKVFKGHEDYTEEFEEDYCEEYECAEEESE